jgi:putative transposase
MSSGVTPRAAEIWAGKVLPNSFLVIGASVALARVSLCRDLNGPKLVSGGIMSNRKKHTKEEISTKLAQASEMAAQGKLQSEIARTLGVSVMTLHRWRKPLAKSNGPLLAPEETTAQFEQDGGGHLDGSSHRIADLQLENSRLRRLVTDLLLEKMKLAEDLEANKSPSERLKLAR